MLRIEAAVPYKRLLRNPSPVTENADFTYVLSSKRFAKPKKGLFSELTNWLFSKFFAVPEPNISTRCGAESDEVGRKDLLGKENMSPQTPTG